MGTLAGHGSCEETLGSSPFAEVHLLSFQPFEIACKDTIPFFQTTMRSAFFFLLASALLAPASAGRTATHEVVQTGQRAVVDSDVKNDTLPESCVEDDSAATADTRRVVEEEEEEEDEQASSEAYSTTVSSPAVKVADVVGSDLGEPQVIDAIIGEEVMDRILDARMYIRNTVNKFPEYKKVRDLCVNKHEHCAFWAGTKFAEMLTFYCVDGTL